MLIHNGLSIFVVQTTNINKKTMRTFQTSMYSENELRDMIESLETMNDEDVKELFGLNTVADAEAIFTEAYEEALEACENCGTYYQRNGFNSAYDYNNFIY